MAGEACDDGNTVSGDGCSADCSLADVIDDGGGACALNVTAEKYPGFPYDMEMLKTQVLPVLQVSCGSAGCHAPGNATPYTVWPDDPSDPLKCNVAKSFNAVHDNSDLINPRNSKLITAVDGTLAPHPIKLETDDPKVALVLTYIENAKAERDSAAGGPTDTSFFFDANVYAGNIQTTFDRAGCAAAGCHDLATAQSGFGITANAAAGSTELTANLEAVASLVTLSGNLDDAEASKIYVFSTNDHAGKVVDNAPALESWIRLGIEAAGRPADGTPVAGCVDTSTFDALVFRDEILPLLAGNIDYNPVVGSFPGCVRGPCHGTDRGPGSLYIDVTRSIDENLARFSCFVDLLDPSASQVLACPLNLRRCANPHPRSADGDIFVGTNDLNYQKLLSYLHATNDDAMPLDFAFFVRNINPLFDDENAVQDGQLGVTCADTTACHCVQVAGQPPPSGSSFGIIPESTDRQGLLLNFVSASNFTYYPDAGQSSLFLYPTNEIANVNNPLATGLSHPGGPDFEVDGAEALAILEWTGGLRPDSNGFLRDWLVAGVFAATQISEEKIFGEDVIAPRIFDRSGQALAFNKGLWDAFSSDNDFVDFAVAFDRNVVNAETAYAVAYVLNTSGRDIRAVITVDSPNDAELFVGDQSSLALEGQTSISATLGAYAQTKQVTRIMVKVFRAAADAQFGFSLRFQDENGNLLTDATGELVFKLSPKGGL